MFFLKDALCWLRIFKPHSSKEAERKWEGRVDSFEILQSVLGIIRNKSITKGMFRISLFLLLRLSLAMKELCELMRCPKKANHRLLFTQDHPESDCLRLRLKGKQIITSYRVISSHIESKCWASQGEFRVSSAFVSFTKIAFPACLAVVFAAFM